MTGINNNNKFVPSTPKTYTVLELRGWQQQPIKQSSLSATARSKVVNRSGSNYISERTTIINPSYGPGFWDNVGDWIEKNAPVIAVRTGIALVSIANPPAGAALAVGVASGGIVARAAGEISGDETAKETGRIMICGSSDRLSEKIINGTVVEAANILNR